ncbi:MAG: hypothetical protein ACRECV_12115 [Xanthobacteraceae bacterium]
MNASAPVIPVIDIRAGGPAQHARQSALQARALRDACLGFFPRVALPALPLFDAAARGFLKRSRSPYVQEIARIAEILDFSGVWLLNASYQWACTSMAREQSGVPWLVRTLDWPFRGLGRHAEVARMRGAGGDFFSITWPGYVGALTAMAPFRFAASINQAPMRRRTSHPWLRPFDVAVNTLASWACIGGMPPDQLLRRAFEACGDYATARRMLETTPIARPAIFTLIGCAAGEICVIERTETGFLTRETETSAANDWVPDRPNWEGRIGARRFLRSSFAEAADHSRARRDALAGWAGSLAERGFSWVRPPVLNPYTRLATAMCPASGILRTIGYDAAAAELPEPVTQLCEIDLAPSLQPI